MDDLATRMRAAVDSPPPTRIDLDALISGELSRRRTLRWASGAAAVAAVVTLAIAAPAIYLPGPGPGTAAQGPGAALAPNTSGTSTSGTGLPSLCAPLSPSPTGPRVLQSYGTVRARPTEPVAQAVPRLTEIARMALRDVLPAGMTVEAFQPGCAAPQFQYHPSYLDYDLWARVRDQQGFGNLLIRLRPTGADERPPCSDDCSRTEHPDGTIVFAQPGNFRQHQVFVVRPEGVTVWLMSNSVELQFVQNQPDRETRTRPEPPVTIEQLVQIGRTPGLTLYP